METKKIFISQKQVLFGFNPEDIPIESLNDIFQVETITGLKYKNVKPDISLMDIKLYCSGKKQKTDQIVRVFKIEFQNEGEEFIINIQNPEEINVEPLILWELEEKEAANNLINIISGSDHTKQFKRNLQTENCSNSCHQCDFLPNLYSQISSVSSNIVDTPLIFNPFGVTGGVQKCTGQCRIGSSLDPNSLTGLDAGFTYTFCVWIKNIDIVNSGAFEFDIADKFQFFQIVDYKGKFIDSGHLVSMVDTFITSTTNWQRFCVNADHDGPSYHRFIDMGQVASGQSFYMFGPQLQRTRSLYATGEEYSEGQTSDRCLRCSHESRIGPQCQCFPGYTQSGSDPKICEAPKPAECEQFIRVESAGLNHNELNSNYLKVFINDVEVGTSSRAINIYIIDETTYTVSNVLTYDTLVTPNGGTITADIAALSAGQLVAVGTVDSPSEVMHADVKAALEQLGMNSSTSLEYREGFAMIGRKGAAPGTAKQLNSKMYVSGRAHITYCLYCGIKCQKCIYDGNLMVFLDGVFRFTGEPVLQPGVPDHYGNMGTVYKNGFSQTRFGTDLVSTFYIGTLRTGEMYQFSLWIRLMSGATVTNFEFDGVDKADQKYLCNQEGDILDIMTGGVIDSYLTENWQRFVVNFTHDRLAIQQFIDVGPASGTGDLYEFSNPYLIQIPDINYPPYEHKNPQNIVNTCEECSHYTRVKPNCDCAPGYEENLPQTKACAPKKPENCFKFARIESSGYRWVDGQIDEYLRMYIESSDLGAFSNGLSIVSVNESTYAVDSQQTFDIENPAFDNNLLITFIDGIPNGRIIMIGTKGNRAVHIDSTGYTALQGLGMNVATTIGIRSGLAMFSVKGDTSKTTEVYSGHGQGGKATIGHCLRECHKQCTSCNTSPGDCVACSDSTTRKDQLNQCNCKDGWFEEDNVLCGECDVQCETCSGTSSSCIACSHINRDLGNSCMCKLGYSQVGSTEVCSLNSCDGGCTLCNLSKTECYECNPIGYFDSNVDVNLATCDNCPQYCNQCSSLSVCSACIGLNRDSSDLCKPNPEYYNKSGQDDAEPCVAPCRNCSSATICLTCRGANREGTSCTPLATFYDKSGQDDAEPCISPCLNCTSPTICQSCRGLNRQEPSCDPIPTFYDKSGQDDAEPCVSPCLNCQSETYCLSCVDTHYHSVDTCILCDYKCDQCTGPGGAGCQQCLGANRNLSNDCKCEDGFYENSAKKCVQCPKNCKKCSSETVCTECPTDDPNRTTNLPNCDCKDYFSQNSEGKCQSSSCNTQVCATCFNGPEDCTLSCNTGCGTCDSTQSCTTCRLGQLLVSGECIDCDSKCEACDYSDKSKCLMCKDTLEEGRYGIEGNCECKMGFYQNISTGLCTECQVSHCQQCNSLGICEICQNSSLQPPLCQQPKSGTIVIREIDPITNEQVVVGVGRCSRKCETCSDSWDSCDSCSLGQNRSSSLPCNCLEGYHDNQGLSQDCIKCPNSCETCLSDTNCISCSKDSNRDRNNYTLMCECKRGYKENSKGECKKCFIYNRKCLLICPSNTIPDLQSFICYERSYSLAQNSTVFYVGFCVLLCIIFTAKLILYFRVRKIKQNVLNSKRSDIQPIIQEQQQQE